MSDISYPNTACSMCNQSIQSAKVSCHWTKGYFQRMSRGCFNYSYWNLFPFSLLCVFLLKFTNRKLHFSLHSRCWKVIKHHETHNIGHTHFVFNSECDTVDTPPSYASSKLRFLGCLVLRKKKQLTQKRAGWLPTKVSWLMQWVFVYWGRSHKKSTIDPKP